MDQEEEWTTVTNPKAKSKQNASQRKESQKSNQKSSTPSVPQQQPAKSNSKSNKKNEINSKGASKEGTDMDLFQISDKVNANVAAPPANNSDVINANTVPETISASPVNSYSNAVDKTNESNDNATIKPAAPVAEVKPAPTKWNVTNVFGGKMPAPPPFIPHPTPDSNRDETDRAALSNDKIIQAKNEANAAKTVNSTNENKPELPYKEGQWSPDNLEGDKVYDKDFLMAARNLPMSRVKPNIPDILDNSSDNRQRQSDYHRSQRTDFTTPPFMSPYGGKNSSMKGPSITKHNSIPGKVNNKGMKSTNGGNKISISLREEIKLHESENAWKPGRLAKADTRRFVQKVRGVLNKLTPQKFDTLLKQIKSLNVDTMDRLQGVINLIFEKALDEPNFSVAYAKMCRELSDDMKCPSGAETDPKVNFRKLLINRCQEEFEKHSKDETVSNEKMKVIEECKDAERKKELQFELEEIYRRIRMRSVGNIRFIGELFKIKMLTANIMITCLNILLSNKDEESLECLCKLLSTVGKDLEADKDLTSFFSIMQEIVDRKHMNCSSRIRFMLQDVIDLRRNKWIPRRQDLNPKTIDQIQKEADNEHLNQAINSVPNTPRKDDRLGGDMMNRGKSRNDDEWTTRQRKPFQFQKDKFKVKAPTEGDLLLGGSSMFQSWGKGSTFKPQTTAPTLTTSTANKFALLDSSSVDNDKKIIGNRYKDSYTSKGSSLERSYGNRADSRSGSQHRMNVPPTISIPSRMPPSMPAPIIPPAKAAAAPVPEHPELSEVQLERYFKNCLDEFINDNATFEECESDIRKTFPTKYMPRMVADGYLGVLEKFSTARLKTGILFAKLIKAGTLPLEEYCMGLEEIFSQVEDLIIDIPTIWTCLAEIIVPVICEESLPFNRLQKCSEVLIGNGNADKLLGSIFKLIITEKGPNFLKNLWRLSDMQFTSFMPDNKVETFIKDNQLEFLTGGETAQGNSEFNYEQIEIKLLEFFNSNADFDDICSWITANVGERVKENQFIRTLATSIYKYSIVRTKLDAERLNKHYKLFQKYVDNNQAYELQCLYALQSLVHNMEHPQGLLLAIFTQLNEDVVFPQESFIAWEGSLDPAEQEGKGVALKQLTSFFTQLKENEEDEDEYASEDSEEA
ncbi:hypothetical protein HHI36_006707 [Cryptolaemus montrouzieri]|uniref:Uncharacterized protein n=1 Tax=Cryptolaemus montrouzieri TaxID=559131 RepID=A0ABD2NYD4_9CUCU